MGWIPILITNSVGLICLTVKITIAILQVCGIEFDRRDIVMNKLVATTLESKFYVFDLRTCNSKKGFASVCEKVNLFFVDKLISNQVGFMFLTL